MTTIMYLEDLQPGRIFRSGCVRVEAAEIKEFAARYDPQPFHLDEAAAAKTFFQGLAASGWHTAALTMKLLVGSELQLAGGILGAGFEELKWPRAVRPGDELRVTTEILEVRVSRSRPAQGLVRVRTTTLNQRDEAVQEFVGTLVVPRRTTA